MRPIPKLLWFDNCGNLNNSLIYFSGCHTYTDFNAAPIILTEEPSNKQKWVIIIAKTYCSCTIAIIRSVIVSSYKVVFILFASKAVKISK